MGWINLPVSAGDAVDPSVFTLEWGNQFIRALRERWHVAQGSASTWVERTGRPAITQLTNANNPARTSASGNNNGINWAALQTDVQSIVPAFVVVQEYNGFPSANGASPAAFPTYTLATWRQAAGIHPDGFTRKFPKMISSTSNAGSAGQRAWMGNEDSEAVGHAQSLARYPIMEHDGSGWVESPDQASPVTVLTRRGIAQPGDYFGEWLPNEIYEGMRKLLWTQAAPSWLGGLRKSTPDGAPDTGTLEPDWTTAYNNEAAELASVVPGPASPIIDGGGYAEYTGTYTAGAVGAEWSCDSSAAKVQATLTVPNRPVDCEMDILIASTGPIRGAGSGFTNIYNNSVMVPGGLVEDQWVLWETRSIAAGGSSEISGEFGSLDIPPNVASPPGASDPSAAVAVGCIVFLQGVRGLLRWDFEFKD